MENIKSGITEDKGLNSLSNVIKLITSIFTKVDTPISPLPPPLILTGANLRPGMSAKEMASNIIARQSEAGAPVGNLYSDGVNIAEAMEVIRCEELLKMLQMKSKIEIVIPPGVPVVSVGANAGGPVISQGVTSQIAQGYGVIR